MKCDACEQVRINGILCHERGCPDAWLDELRECRECGTKFYPQAPNERECSHSCLVAYTGHPCGCDECSYWALDDGGFEWTSKERVS